jgi:SulP family sulfate permease
VAVSVEFCIIIGVFLSFVLYLRRAAQVRLTPLMRTPENGFRERRPGEAACDRLLLYQLEGELFFGVEPELKQHFAAVEEAAHGAVRAVILVLERARNPDAAFLNLLRALDRGLRRREVALFLCGVDAELGKALADAGLAAQLGAGRIVRDAGALDAVLSACGLLGGPFCSTCPRRPESAGDGQPWDYVI